MLYSGKALQFRRIQPEEAVSITCIRWGITAEHWRPCKWTVWHVKLFCERLSVTSGWVNCHLESLWLHLLNENQPPMYGASWNNWVKRVEIAPLKTHIWLMSPAFPRSTGGERWNKWISADFECLRGMEALHFLAHGTSCKEGLWGGV